MKPEFIERANGTKEWYLDGLLHREDGPAVEHADGTKEWWTHGKLGRPHTKVNKETNMYINDVIDNLENFLISAHKIKVEGETENQDVGSLIEDIVDTFNDYLWSSNY